MALLLFDNITCLPQAAEWRQGDNISPLLNFSLPSQSVANSELFDYLQISTQAAAAAVVGPSGYVPPHVMWAPSHLFCPEHLWHRRQPIVQSDTGSKLSDIEAEDEGDSQPSSENSSVLDLGATRCTVFVQC